MWHCASLETVDPAIARVKRTLSTTGNSLHPGTVAPGIHLGANLDQPPHKQRAGTQHAALQTCTAWGWVGFLWRLARSGGEDQPPRRRRSASFLPRVRVWVNPPTAMACTRAHPRTYVFCSRMGLGPAAGSMGSPINLRGMADRGRFPPMFLRHLRSLPLLHSVGFRSYVPHGTNVRYALHTRPRFVSTFRRRIPAVSILILPLPNSP